MRHASKGLYVKTRRKAFKSGESFAICGVFGNFGFFAGRRAETGKDVELSPFLPKRVGTTDFRQESDLLRLGRGDKFAWQV